MAAGDTQITIARNLDLRSRALSAWLTRNADGASYRPNCEARRQPRRKIWQTHHHPGSAEGRTQRAKLPGSPVPVRLRKRVDARSPLPYIRRREVVRMLARAAQI